ncbi:(2Fe-2S) ferredoxin domain-containing protein [Proteinivorax hydrogeniformans]|uniref:(2Fe-2S) ferredoxin domain-containing protein n=1 Tax=Proteinivorax hydrogeniformans TaxID=1826727 RepID=A0AAU8HVK5_9FIRM
MKTLKELRDIREKASAKLKARNAADKSTIKVQVGMGTCGISSGARDTFMAILEEANNKNIDNLSITQVGCLGNCFEEPVVRLIYPGQKPKIFVNVDVEKAKEIIEEIKS